MEPIAIVLAGTFAASLETRARTIAGSIERVACDEPPVNAISS